MKVSLCTSVASVFIELQNLFSSENDRTRLIFTRPGVVLTRNCNFKMAVDLLERVSYTCENLYSYTILDKESEFTFTFAQKSTDNIFKMAALSVKRSITKTSQIATIVFQRKYVTMVTYNFQVTYIIFAQRYLATFGKLCTVLPPCA